MLAELRTVCGRLGDVLSAVDPAVLSGVDCAQVVELLAGIEKRCAGLRALAAGRAAECGAHRQRGYSDPTVWLAQTSGISGGDARATFDTAAGLASCPQTREALLAGELSLTQAAEITKTEAARPGSESVLLEVAGRSGVAGLRDAARKRRWSAEDPDQRYRRQRQARHGRFWQDEHGMIRLAGAFSPDVGVGLANRVNTECDRLARQARRDGSADTREMLMADALAKVLTEGGKPRAHSAELVLVCDASAYRRGHAHAGEVCQVIGGGPVPVSVARELAATAFVKAVLHDGVAVDTVVHHGRHIKAEVRTALGLGAPPEFDGTVCVDEPCDRRYHLEWDHVNPVANNGPTSIDNLVPRCWTHHQEKTERDQQAGLLTPHPAAPAAPVAPVAPVVPDRNATPPDTDPP